MKSLTLTLPGTLMLAAVLGGCGGSSDPTSASSTSTGATGSSGSQASGAVMIEPSQQSADTLVTTVNSSTVDVATAQSVSALTSGASSMFVNTTATVSGDYPCSSLGVNGSGDVAYNGSVNATTGMPQSLTLDFNACQFTAFLNSYAFNGTESASFSNYTSPAQFTLVENWDVTVQVSGAWNFNRTFDGSASCTQAGSDLNCSYDLGTSQITAGFAASLNGSIVTVSSATLTTRSLNLVLNDWVYDAALGYATTGTITATDADGNTGTIMADGNGVYTVTEVVNGVTYTYTVTK